MRKKNTKHLRLEPHFLLWDKTRDKEEKDKGDKKHPHLIITR